MSFFIHRYADQNASVQGEEAAELSKLKEDFSKLQKVHDQNLTRLNAFHRQNNDLRESLSKKDEEIAIKVFEEVRKVEEQAEEQAEKSKEREEVLKKSHLEELEKLKSEQIERDQIFEKKMEFFTNKISKLTQENEEEKQKLTKFQAKIEEKNKEKKYAATDQLLNKSELDEDIIKENQKLKVDKENLQYQVESYKRGTKKTTLAFESYENQIKDLQVSTPHNYGINI